MLGVLNKKELAELDALKFEFCETLQTLIHWSLPAETLTQADCAIDGFTKLLHLHHRIQNFQSIVFREREDRKNYLAGGR